MIPNFTKNYLFKWQYRNLKLWRISPGLYVLHDDQKKIKYESFMLMCFHRFDILSVHKLRIICHPQFWE